ncbi:MAG: hypothetical protein IJ779_11040 [Ruminococcus sp.]|nr:hypothetical protein [Ruminococcus sp.]
MKKIVSLVTAAVLAAAVSASCGQKTTVSNKAPEANPAVSRQSESYEDALRECFNASFSLNGGEIFYSYMYLDGYIQDMKDKGDYNSVINNFNENQKQRPDLTDGVYAFGEIKESTPVTDKQIAAVKTYFVSKSSDRMEITEDSIDVQEGYEVSYTYTKNGEENGNDVALAVKIGGEGWKVIPN